MNKAFPNETHSGIVLSRGIQIIKYNPDGLRNRYPINASASGFLHKELQELLHL
jgi:hypothetical protein